MTTRMHIELENPAGVTAVAVLVAVLSTLACSVSGGGAEGNAGSGGAAGGSAGSGGGGNAGQAGAGAGGGGVSGSGGSNTAGVGVPDAGGGADAATGVTVGLACAPKTSFTLAIHIVVSVSWDETLGTNAGTGAFHLWNLARMTTNGTALTGTTQPCGNTLPALTFKPLVGGGMGMVEVPDAVWDLPMAPKFPTVGTLAAWTTGSALMTMPTIALVGLTMPDPEGPWPVSYTGLTAVDVEADGNPGITGIPRTATGYVQPPVTTPIAGFGARADRLFLASRTGVGLNGTLTSCTEQSGTATVKFFDNHIVGCHVNGGADCTPAQINFVDTNRTKFAVTGATFTSKIVADDATCAAVRGM